MTTSMTPERNAYLREILVRVFEQDLRSALRLTRRQEEVARTWLASGSYEEAGRRLGITGQAVMMHVQRIATRAEHLLPTTPQGEHPKAA